MTLPAIVLVDDDSTSLQRLKDALAPMGTCTTVAFADSREALAWCTRVEPSLVITCCQTKGFDSLDLIRDLRRRELDVPILILTASRDRGLRHQGLTLGATDYLLKPIDPIEVRARAQNMLALGRAQKSAGDRARLVADEVRAATAAGCQRERETILRFAKAAEARDWPTGSHALRIADYARIIAKQLGLPEGYQETVHLAAPLHDVGKIGVPDRILVKPGELTPEEMAVIRRHSVIGHEILAGSTSDVLQMAATIALTHHERHDGSGYPAGSSGESIPMEGRIVSIADVFDTLVSPRPYKPAWSLESSIRHIMLGSGCLFDPACVAAFESGLSDIVEAHQRLRDQGPGAMAPYEVAERLATLQEASAATVVTRLAR
jgi:response regulator RpfG family c-di-GMP phosphodiesterase